MTLTGLTSSLLFKSSYRNLIETLRTGSSNEILLDVPRGAKGFLLGGFLNDLRRPVLWLHPTSESARRGYSEIESFIKSSGYSKELYYYPEPDALPFEKLNNNENVTQERLKVMAGLLMVDGRAQDPDEEDNPIPQVPPLVVASVDSIARLIIEPDIFLQKTLIASSGQDISIIKMSDQLLKIGYENVSIVDKPGKFSRRRGLLDVWSPHSELPTRIEFFSDTIESLRYFDPETQLSIKKTMRCKFVPARELILDGNQPGNITIPKIKKILPTIDSDSNLNQLISGTYSADAEFYTSLFHSGTMFDYLGEDSIIVNENTNDIRDTWIRIEAIAKDYKKRLVSENLINQTFPDPIISFSRFELITGDMRRNVQFQAFARTPRTKSDKTFLNIGFESVSDYQGNIVELGKDLGELIKSGNTVVLISLQSKRLASLLKDQGLDLTIEDQLSTLPAPASLTLYHGNIESGWALRFVSEQIGERKIIILTDSEIFGLSKNRNFRFRSKKSVHQVSDKLNRGDLVVHIEHGIGKFDGLIKRNLDESEREYMVLEYAKGDRLYVPTNQIDRVKRYVGTGNEPSLSHLGGADWIKSKEKAKEAALEFARELLRLYAAREFQKRIPMEGESHWEWQLESSFPYEETEDQIRAIQDINNDMESDTPMDRLLCGDVGFGKTEIALRAAFKAVASGFQVAVLVPTTVLAQQHYNTFKDRLSIFPTRIDMLSRLRTESQNAATVEGINTGDVDIVIGTHRLLSKDVNFKKLGLLIIDEEQRFGVRHKEQLKKTRTTVDILTMTATPIPRTLHMALFGIRDMSRIENGPGDRQPVTNFVSEYDETVVRDAIMKEINRGGQVFYVHNRVIDMDAIFEELKDLCPGVSFGVAHGRMLPSAIEKVMESFAAGKLDVLICTTIVQSGLDIPNANTLIVDEADKLGLTQLYQLRGRVGRSSIKAYAFFLFKKRGVLTITAENRLRAIMNASELGSGYKLAMKDLQIRGSGDILGSDQSGHVSAIGFDLYTRLLNEAVDEARGIVAPPQADKRSLEESSLQQLNHISVELPVDAYIPESYISDLTIRLSVYEELVENKRNFQLEIFLKEIEDRFGPAPQTVKDLLLGVLLRNKINNEPKKFVSVSSSKREMSFTLKEGARFDRQALRLQINNLEVGNRKIYLKEINNKDFDWRKALINLVDLINSSN
jgi:transcription-repair coupling factor (superfamily II helicase)